MRRCITTSSEQYKLAFAVSMGGMLELYDFLIYALMASYIAEHFFPRGRPVFCCAGNFCNICRRLFDTPNRWLGVWTLWRPVWPKESIYVLCFFNGIEYGVDGVATGLFQYRRCCTDVSGRIEVNSGFFIRR